MGVMSAEVRAYEATSRRAVHGIAKLAGLDDVKEVWTQEPERMGRPVAGTGKKEIIEIPFGDGQMGLFAMIGALAEAPKTAWGKGGQDQMLRKERRATRREGKGRVTADELTIAGYNGTGSLRP